MLAASPPQLGAVIDGKYRIERALGRGGVGWVLAARHVRLGNLVAIKFLVTASTARSDAVERLLREARAVMRLQSEHVARVFDVGIHDEWGPFLVMEHLEGQDLSQLLRSGPVSVGAAVEYILQACKALAEVHAKGIVHRDIKPSNLFLTQRADGTPWIKIIDFGLAKDLQDADAATLTTTGTMLGSLWFMAPEQMRGASSLDERCDIWALGATLHALVTGAPPFPGNNVLDVHDQILAGPPTLTTVCPGAAALEDVVQSCLRLAASGRYASVAQLAEALVNASARLDTSRSEPARRTAESSQRAEPVQSSTTLQPTQPPLDPSWLSDPAAQLDAPTALTTTVAAAGNNLKPWLVASVIGGLAVSAVAGVVLHRNATSADALPAPIPSEIAPRAQAPAPTATVEALAQPRLAEPQALPKQTVAAEERKSTPLQTSARSVPRSSSAPRKAEPVAVESRNVDPLADPD